MQVAWGPLTCFLLAWGLMKHLWPVSQSFDSMSWSFEALWAATIVAMETVNQNW